MNNYTIVDRSLATKWTRFFNHLIDLSAFYILILFIGLIIGIWHSLTNSELAYSLIQAMNNVNGLVDRVFTMILYAVFLFLQEWIFKGRSIGKFITGTKAVNETNKPLNTIDLLKRNLTRAVPFEAFSFLGNLGLHDKWSDTRVVKIKLFEENLKSRNEIEEIGQVVA
ncbi:RDD family protein [Elizabethkingia meningoseptica]|uniref:RDD domain-containing protein n=4 Tax=Weeksellaceae TaxID=2762318 RepID=A0A1V3U538_ELIME|nr:hypothetical protein BBD33_01415 [Elizabethkingia meningoseptica]EOR30306.1 RDD domain-containing protein [Elizabethkingia meningoseptica ATCC 13253 = NBRC 12535]AQX14183.1 hypothetical protein BBD35_03235 [Elizabethkingia meningoseptica]AQX48983.1 hypothetical protein B5G46_01410 [Elizabethkingia meningoseptica]EJK5329204.1 RDD family protein [Elizabethkingia meningoseptica]